MNEIAMRKHIYNQYRTTLLNHKYHSRLLKIKKQQNSVMEIVIAIGIAGSGISGWQLWQTTYGLEIWGVIAGFSALLAIIKPLLKLADKVELYSKLFTGHTKMYNELKALVMAIDNAPLADQQYELFNDIFRRYGELTALEEPVSNRKLIKKLQKEVNNEIPSQSLWMPEA